MRTISTEQQAALDAPLYKVTTRVYAEDGDSKFRPLHSLENYDWIDGIDYGEDIDMPVSRATLRLFRNVYQMSLSPLMAQSKFNRDATDAYAPLLDLGREVIIETITGPEGTEPAPSNWLALGGQTWSDLAGQTWADVAGDNPPELVFRGEIQNIDWGGRVQVTVFDPGSALKDTFIEDEREYGAENGSIHAEDVIQSILDDNIGGITLFTPAPSNFAIRPYTQRKEPTLNASRNVALQRPWDLRYVYQESTGDFELTFQAPDRTKTTPDHTFGPDQYLDVQRIGVTKAGIRTIWRVVFTDTSGNRLTVEYPYTGEVSSATSTTITDTNAFFSTDEHAGRLVRIWKGTGKGQERTISSNTTDTLTVTAAWDTTPDATSKYAITDADDSAAPLEEFGRLFAEIAEAASSQTDTAEEARAMAKGAYQDTSRVKAELEIPVHYFFAAQLGDLYRFSANAEHFDTDQDFAVVAVRHTLAGSMSGGQDRTVFVVRGKPAGAYKEWHLRGARPGVAKPAPLTGVTAPWLNNRPDRAREDDLEEAQRLRLGFILMWSGAIIDIPAGWQLCDGTNGTPDLRDRFIVGAGSAYTPGDTGGEDTHTLTTTEMPSHTHNARMEGAGGTAIEALNRVIADNFGGLLTGSAGGDQPHENRPPFYALAFIMKIV